MEIYKVEAQDYYFESGWGEIFPTLFFSNKGVAEKAYEKYIELTKRKYPDHKDMECSVYESDDEFFKSVSYKKEFEEYEVSIEMVEVQDSYDEDFFNELSNKIDNL